MKNYIIAYYTISEINGNILELYKTGWAYSAEDMFLLLCDDLGAHNIRSVVEIKETV